MANIVRRNEGSPWSPAPTSIRSTSCARCSASIRCAPSSARACSTMQQTFMPQFEIRETPDAYIFKADMPGVRDEDLDITMAQNRLTVSGHREMTERDENDRYYAIERAYGSFTRTFTLPTDIDPARVDAELRDGVLTLKVPKSPEQQPKKVQVKSSSTPGGGGKTAKAGSA